MSNREMPKVWKKEVGSMTLAEALQTVESYGLLTETDTSGAGKEKKCQMLPICRKCGDMCSVCKKCKQKCSVGDKKHHKKKIPECLECKLKREAEKAKQELEKESNKSKFENDKAAFYLIDDARLRLKAGDLNMAIGLYTKAIEDFPSHDRVPYWYTHLSACYTKLAQFLNKENYVPIRSTTMPAIVTATEMEDAALAAAVTKANPDAATLDAASKAAATWRAAVEATAAAAIKAAAASKVAAALTLDVAAIPERRAETIKKVKINKELKQQREFEQLMKEYEAVQAEEEKRLKAKQEREAEKLRKDMEQFNNFGDF